MRNPFARDLGRQGFERDRLRLQVVAQLVKRGIERGDHGGVRSPPHGFVSAGEFREVVRQPVGCARARSGLSAGRLLQSIDRGLERGDIIGVCRRFLVGVGPQHGIEHSRELTDGGKLGLLVSGDETLDRLYARDLR